MPYIRFFSEIGEEDKDSGIKGINLSVLSKKGFRTPPGFVITREVSDLIFSKMRREIDSLFMCREEEVAELSYKFQQKVKSAAIPENIKEEIEEAYMSLSVTPESSAESLLKAEEVFVAVRSSYLDDMGFIPMLSQKTILNVKGYSRLISAITDCFSELFSKNNIAYRRENNLREISTAVVIQRMIDSDFSGIAYTINPETGNKTEMIVKACFGLGETFSGNMVPDTYIINSEDMIVKDVFIGEKKYQYVRDIESGFTIKQDLNEKSKKQVLDDKDAVEVARLARKAANIFNSEQKIEWVMRKGMIYLMQSKFLQEKEDDIKEPGLNAGAASEEYPPEEEESSGMIDIIDQDEEISNAGEDLPLGEEDIQGSKKLTEADITINQEKEEVVEAQEIKIEEDSIISSYRGFGGPIEPIKTKDERFAELAKLNMGNALVYSCMSVKEELSEKLKRYSSEIPGTLIDILDALLRYEPVEKEEMIRKLDKSAKEFISKNAFPGPDEIRNALMLIK